MDMLKYFDITHREHVLCNPMSVEKFQELIALLRLDPGDRVLEIATGKGEFISSWRSNMILKGQESISLHTLFRMPEKNISSVFEMLS